MELANPHNFIFIIGDEVVELFDLLVHHKSLLFSQRIRKQ